MWTRTFGGSNGDYGYCIDQTSDGGYIMTGYTESYGAGSSDVWLIKTNASGDTIWTKTYGGSNSDVAFSLKQTSDGGFIISGFTMSYGIGGRDIWLIKTDASGDTTWTKTFGGSGTDEGGYVDLTLDGGYIITGNTTSYGSGEGDVWLIKTDTNGETLWSKTFGGNDTDYGKSIKNTTDDGYIIVGTTESHGTYGSVYLIRLDGDAPSPPQNLVTIAGNTQVTLSWTANSESDFSKYKIYRSTTSSFTPSSSNKIAEPTTNNYTDVGLNNGTTYYYKISAVDNAGNESEYSNEVTAMPHDTNTYYSLTFDGTEDYVEIPNIINGLDSVTFEAWFKYDNSDTWRWIYGCGPDWVDVGASIAGGGNTIRYHFRTTGGSFGGGPIDGEEDDGTTQLSTNRWYHFAMTYDGSSIKGYINSQLDFQNTITGSIVTTTTQMIGAGFTNNNEYFMGNIDEVRIWDRVLSQTDIQSKMNMELEPLLRNRVGGLLAPQ